MQAFPEWRIMLLQNLYMSLNVKGVSTDVHRIISFLNAVPTMALKVTNVQNWLLVFFLTYKDFSKISQSLIKHKWLHIQLCNFTLTSMSINMLINICLIQYLYLKFSYMSSRKNIVWLKSCLMLYFCHNSFYCSVLCCSIL